MPSMADSLVHTIGGSRLIVSYSDIVTLPVEAIVSSDDVRLSMGGGVSRAILRAAGAGLAEEARRVQPLALGDVVVSGGGNLRQTFVLHAAVLDYALPDLGVSEAVVRTAVRHCFEECARRGIRSIGFPALAAGTAKLSPEQSASAILVETLAYLETRASLEEVHIALYPVGLGNVQERFFLKVRQYLAVCEAEAKVDSAIEGYEQFAAPKDDASRPTPAEHDPGPARHRGATVQTARHTRETLDASMVSAPDADFSERIAPQLLQGLDARIDKVQAALTSEPLGDNVRLRAETLRLLRLRAFNERLRLEGEDISRGSETADSRQRKAFLRTQEEKLAAELADLEQGTRPVVISIHGIRTRGTWQKEMTPSLNYAGFTHVPLDYGRFGLFSFLWRPSRQKQVTAFREAYRLHGARTAKGSPSVIAHSLGSYIVTEAMAKYNLRFDRMVLCGAIVRRDYDWDTAYGARFFTRVLNDHGRLDIWARVAERVLSDAGQSGLKGFTRLAGGHVVNRDHARFGHSDYFYEQNYNESWIPFLLGHDPAPIANLDATNTNWKFWLTIGIVGVILLYVILR